jgi:hypothetical protein
MKFVLKYGCLCAFLGIMIMVVAAANLLTNFQFAVVLVALIFLPIILVLASATYGWHLHQASIKFAATSPCPKCGRNVGIEAVNAGITRSAQRGQELRKQHPGKIFKLVAEWEIECPHCGFRFYFYPSGNKIETTSILANKPLRPTLGEPNS